MSPWLSVKIFFRTDFAHVLFLKYFIPGILLLLLGPSLLFSSPGVHDYQGIHGWVPEFCEPSEGLCILWKYGISIRFLNNYCQQH